jgi:predicted phosphoadenosine phosphosulfate sulfurtransferase
VQEIEPKTWEKVAKRIDGANTIKHLKDAAFTCPESVPFMFKDWEDYSLYLIEKLVVEEKNRLSLHKLIAKYNPLFTDDEIRQQFFRSVVRTIMASDWDFTRMANWLAGATVLNYVYYKQGKATRLMLEHTRYFSESQKQDLLNKIQQNEIPRSTD